MGGIPGGRTRGAASGVGAIGSTGEGGKRGAPRGRGRTGASESAAGGGADARGGMGDRGGGGWLLAAGAEGAPGRSILPASWDRGIRFAAGLRPRGRDGERRRRWDGWARASAVLPERPCPLR